MWDALRRLFGRAKRPPEPPAPSVPRAKHEGLRVHEKLQRYKGGHVTLAGDVVQSKPELRIANFLFKHNLRYIYEAQLEGATPDFYLPEHNLIIEHWGMTHTKYIEKREGKKRIYLSRGYKLVETEKKDVPHLERVLEARLRKAVPEIFGLDRGSGSGMGSDRGGDGRG